jgi:hypothetical protein
VTLPIERTYALVNTRNFLRRLLSREETPRVPKDIRREAKYLLKHYPWDSEIKRAALKCPQVFGYIDKEIESL